MRRWLPRTLFGQILIALLAGLLAAQAIGAWLVLDDRGRLAARLLGAYAAQRIAGIVSLLDDEEPGERPRLVQALSVPPTRISLDEPWRDIAKPPSEEAATFARHLQQMLPPARELQVLSLVPGRWGRGREGRTRRPGASGEPAGAELRAPDAASPKASRREGRFALLFVLAQVRLQDGAVATFRHALPQAPADRPFRLLALVAVTGITVALLAGWTVRRLTRPLATLADAASGLASNLDRPPLPETGPVEVARAAQAFNAMQRALKALLETRAETLAAVSHDLRLPLTRVRLRLEQVPDAEVKRSIEADLDAMESMIAGTLEFLRAGASGERAIRLNINALVESAADDVEALGARVRIRGGAAPIEGRPEALRRCLANLLENARRYGGGDIEVDITDTPADVRIRIQDRGPGIPASERERVFEPYVRLDPSRAKHTGGAGLGLAIARAVARAQGGDVTLSERPAGGLCAELRLPRMLPEST